MHLGTFVSDANIFVLSSFASRLACGISSVDSGSSSKLSDSAPRCFLSSSVYQFFPLFHSLPVLFHPLFDGPGVFLIQVLLILWFGYCFL